MPHSHASALRPVVVPISETNTPVCVQKAWSSESCNIQATHRDSARYATSLVAAQPFAARMEPLMADTVGGWHPVSERAVTWAETHTDFGMPRGMRYLSAQAHLKANAELGRNGLWVPVTRTHTQQDPQQVGLWMHYARGCSDFVWSVGRTMLVRNKCEAACTLEHLVHKGALTWAASVDRVARKLAGAAIRLSFQKAWVTRGRGEDALLPVQHEVEANLSVPELRRYLDECAHGRHAAAQENTSRLVKSLVSGNALDYLSAANLAALDEDVALDTIQFANLCDTGSSAAPGCDGNVEIWDVRTLRGLNLTEVRRRAQLSEDYLVSLAAANSMEARERLRRGYQDRCARQVRADQEEAERMPTRPALHARLGGTRCNLSASWTSCLACADSASQLSCDFKCHLAAKERGARQTFRRPLSPPHPRNWTLTRDPTYGGLLSPIVGHWLQNLGGGANALSLARTWAFGWMPLLGAVLNLATMAG